MVRLLGILTSGSRKGCAECRAHNQLCARHTDGPYPLRTTWPTHIVKVEEYSPSPEIPKVAHGLMTDRRKRAMRWLREAKKRGGLSNFARLLVA